MKRLLPTIALSLLCIMVTSQSTDVFAEQLSEDATFLRTGSIGDDDCYQFKLGEAILRGNVEYQISRKDIEATLGLTPDIIAKDGCSAVVSVEQVSLIIINEDGSQREYPADQMHNISETKGLSQRLLYNAVSVAFTNIRFTDSDGKEHTLSDKVFAIN